MEVIIRSITRPHNCPVEKAVNMAAKMFGGIHADH
jgi:hypothetical protein